MAFTDTRRSSALVAALPALLGLFVCACSNNDHDSANRIVFTSIAPFSYVIERIGADRIETNTLVPPDQSPHTYSPPPSQMARLSEATMFFRAGVEFEYSLMPKIRGSAPHMTIIDLRHGISLREMNAQDHTEQSENRHNHRHDHAHRHDHTDGLDPHFWMDPMRMKKAAQTVRDALIKNDPAGDSLYRVNYQALAADLDSVHAALTRILQPVRGKKIFVFHPAFGYFAEAYGLEQVAVEIAGKEPGARGLARVIEQAQAANARVLFVQPQFSSKSARAIAENINGAVVPIDPLARKYLDNMHRIARIVKKGLTQSASLP